MLDPVGQIIPDICHLKEKGDSREVQSTKFKSKTVKQEADVKDECILNDTHRNLPKFRTQGWSIKQEYLTDKEYIEYHVKTEGGQIVKVKVEQEKVEQE